MELQLDTQKKMLNAMKMFGSNAVEANGALQGMVSNVVRIREDYSEDKLEKVIDEIVEKMNDRMV